MVMRLANAEWDQLAIAVDHLLEAFPKRVLQSMVGHRANIQDPIVIALCSQVRVVSQVRGNGWNSNGDPCILAYLGQ